MINFFSLLKLMRPKQWVKNFFVLAPLVFSGLFVKLPSVIDALIAMALFCVASSLVYIINDAKDIEKDRLHPTKSQTRPLASGAVSLSQAFVLMAVLVAVLVVGCIFKPQVMVVIGFYIALNLAYTFKLKHEPVLDIFSIAIGFVMRVVAGSVAISVPISHWMLVTTLSLALYLASIKRRQELLQQGSDSRSVLGKYSVELIDRYAEMSATGALVFYSMFVSTARPELVITVPIVIFGLFRYWYIVHTVEGGESPTDALIEDKQLLLSVVLWCVICTYALLPK